MLQSSRYLVDSAEIRKAAELMVGEFGVDADNIVGFYTSKWARERDYRIAAIEEKGEIVCCLAEIPIPLRIRGQATIAGGITVLVTKKALRRQGLASRLMNETIEKFKGRGFGLSILHTSNHDFYRRFGYFNIPLPYFKYPLAGATHKVPLDVFEVKAFELEDLPEIMRIYDIDNLNRSLAVDRDEAYWRENITWFGPHQKYSFKVARRNTDNVAYMRTRPTMPKGDYLDVIEVGVLPDFADALLCLLDDACGKARTLGLMGLSGHLPPEHPLRTFFPDEANWEMDWSVMVLPLDQNLDLSHLANPQDNHIFWSTERF